MFSVISTNKFQRDVRLLKKRNLADFKLLEEILLILGETGYKGLDKKHRPHKLSGNLKGFWECHIKPDLLLIWDESETLMLIELIRTGTHSDLFKK